MADTISTDKMVAIVNRQNFNAIIGGGSVGLLSDLWQVVAKGNYTLRNPFVITGIAGGILGQSLFFYLGRHLPDSKYNKVVGHFIPTPVPAVIGGISLIGLTFILQNKKN